MSTATRTAVRDDDGNRGFDLTMEDLQNKTPEDLRDIISITEAHLRELHQDERGSLRILDEAEQAAFDIAMEIRNAAMDMLDKHNEIRSVLQRRPKSVERALSSMGHRDDDPYSNVRRMTHAEARDKALRVLDTREAKSSLSAPQMDQVEKQVRRDSDIAKRLLVTETEHYRSAWMKVVTDPNGMGLLDDEERNALRAYQEYRAMSEGVTTAGGFGIPVFIDPSIILTAQESGNPFLTLARQVTVNTNAWKGVSSAGVTWQFQAEAATATDASPVLAQPSVTVFMARGLIPFSIEVGQDYPSFADEMATLLAAGYDELLVDKFTRGSGSNEPRGILTALSANTNVRITLTTSGSIGSPDPYKVWAALPQKFRRRANWLMSVDVNNKFRQLGTANVFHAYTQNLPAEWADILFGKGVYESPYMPDSTTSTSATTGLAVVGDWQNYVLARRGGMTVELIQNLVDVTTNMPTGQRAWFGYARIGGNSVNDLGFRLLVNT